ncbi:MAG: FtsQ-type POTRA domain-containing protein [Clostridiales bacterium]|nr:FtsQ-type POTRA domain-containing protein [Clostridiales bacterium]
MKYSEAQRKKRGKRKKKNYFRNIVIAVLVVLGSYYIAFHSGIFDIKEVKVEGNVHYTTGQVKELSGVVYGDNIFRTRVSEVAKRLELDPYIRKAEVSWALPAGIDILLDERKESVLIAYEEGYVVVDYDGVILRTTREHLKMPVMAGLTPIEPEPGLALRAEEAGQLKPGLDFMKFIEDNNFYIKRLDLSGVVPKAYVFDRLVVEGDLRNMEKNIREIKRVVADLDSKGIERGTISVGSTSCSFSPEIRS